MTGTLFTPEIPIRKAWFSTRLTSVAILSLLATAGPMLPAQTTPHPVLGTGHGIDHATVLTRNLEQASSLYAERLGFTVTPQGKYENGFENAAIYFADHTYLELFGIYNANAVAKSDDAYALDTPEGLVWLILHVSSIDSTASHLRAQGFQLFGPDSFPGPDPWYYRLTGSVTSPLAGRRVFYIEYNDSLIDAWRAKDPEKTAKRQTHANGAESLRSVWVAVKDLDSATRGYERVGFVTGRDLTLPHLQARGREIVAGKGTILLVEASAAGSPVRTFLGEREDAFLGVSLKVGDLAPAQALLAAHAGAPPVRYEGPYGTSINAPPDLAGGAYVEFYQ